MAKRLFLLFSHKLTEKQKSAAYKELGISEIVSLPKDLQEKYSQVPADLPSLKDYAQSILDWLKSQSKKGDYVLIQGEFGLVFIMIQHAFKMGLVPVYSTTKRDAVEVHNEDGSVSMIHSFKHVRFRKYEKI